MTNHREENTFQGNSVIPNQCENCDNSFPLSAERCPHCAQPGLFPNVSTANQPGEYDALNKRYEEAMGDAESRGVLAIADGLEAAISNSYAVIARSLTEVERLASSGNELYATFYQLNESGVRLPRGEKWDVLRALTDTALFPNYKQHIRFASLSLDGLGISHYGECTLVLRDEMIAHRASVFEENSGIFMERHNIKISEAHELPLGYRAVWEDRGKLGIAKLAGRLRPETKLEDFPGILQRDGKTSEEDEFVEAHIWGPMTVRTFERVIIRKRVRSNAGNRAIIRALGEKLRDAKVELEVV